MSLELGSPLPLRLTAHGSGPQISSPFPSVEPSPHLALVLPSLATTAGRAAAPFITYSPSPLPAPGIHQVCPPLFFPSAVRDGAPRTLTKLFVFGSFNPVTIYYLLTSISFAKKIIGCKCTLDLRGAGVNVHSCRPMLGPPLSVLAKLDGFY